MPDTTPDAGKSFLDDVFDLVSRPPEPTVSPGPVSLKPADLSAVWVDPPMAAARAAGRREALAEMAAWHKAQEAAELERADHERRAGPLVAARRHYRNADVHALSARHARALAAAADDPAGPLPVRVRVRPCHDYGGVATAAPHVALRVFAGPEHGGAHLGTLVIRPEELAALRAGWPGAAFVEETPRGNG